METKRIFPAEVIYQMKGWNRNEFDMLQDGSVEEYLLNLFDFRLIQLVPANFLDFMLTSWHQAKPVISCQKVKSEVLKDLHNNKSKLNLVATQFVEIMLQQLGPKVNLVYLPSQVAAVAMHLAMKQLLIQDFECLAVLRESAKIQGYGTDDWEQDMIGGIELLREEVENLDLVQRFQGND